MRAIFLHFLAAATLHADPAFRLQQHPGKLSSPLIKEASGLAVSPSNADFLWIVNDSGGTNELHLANTDGTPRGSVSVAGADNRDWEDLAGFSMDGKDYLLIADTGDNGSIRKSITLYIVQEPPLPAGEKILSADIPVAWEIHFTFEGGAQDCEAVAVDAQGKKIFLVTKRTEPPMVYELPLRPESDPIARKIGFTETKASGLTLPIAFRNQPTGIDISADGTMATISTYHGAFLFRRKAGESWADTLSKNPEPLGPHGLQQAEAIAFSRDGKSIYLVSEGKDSPIARFVAQP